jgi:hypothetical protein
MPRSPVDIEEEDGLPVETGGLLEWWAILIVKPGGSFSLPGWFA